MKKFLPCLLSLLLVVTSFSFNTQSLHAEEDPMAIVGYTADLSTLPSFVQNNFSSVILKINEDAYDLYVNDEYIASCKGPYLHYPMVSTLFVDAYFSFDMINNTMSMDYFYTDNGYAFCYVAFNSDKDGNLYARFVSSHDEGCDTITHLATLKENGILDFGIFNYTYSDGSTMMVEASIDTNTSKAIVYFNGVKREKILEKSSITRTLYYEQYYKSQPIEVEYLSQGMDREPFNKAKRADYYNLARLNQAVAGKSITLVNKQTNITIRVPLQISIGMLHRVSGNEVGTGEYTEGIGEITVVATYEELTQEQRNELGIDSKLYAVMGTDTHYLEVENNGTSSYYGNIVGGTLYRNISWDDPVTVKDYNSIISSLSSEARSYLIGTYQYRYPLTVRSSGYIYTSDPGALTANPYYLTSASRYQKRSYHLSDLGNFIDSSTTYQLAKNNPKYIITSNGTTNGYIRYDYKAQFPSVTSSNYLAGNKTSNADNPYRRVYRYKLYNLNDKLKLIPKETRYSEKAYDDEAFPGYQVIMESGSQKGEWKQYSISQPAEGNKPNDVINKDTATKYKTTTIQKYNIKEKIYTSWSKELYTSKGSASNEEWRQITAYNYHEITSFTDWNTGDIKSYSQEAEKGHDYVDKLFTYQKPHIVNSPRKGRSEYGGKDYWTGKTVTGDYSDYVIYDSAIEVDKTVGVMESMTENMIYEEKDIIASARARVYAYDDMVENKQLLDYYDVVELAESNHTFKSLGEKYAQEQFLDAPIFIPYIYFKGHWRATSMPTTYNAYTDVVENVTITNIPQEKTATVPISPYAQPFRKCRVIFFDYHDPLGNFETLPANWQGHEDLLEEIRNIDLDNPEIQMVISREDMIAMDEWLHNGGYDAPPGEFLRTFRHIITISTPELDAWLDRGY